MRRLILVTILSAVINGCATQQIPPPPEGDTCVVDVANKGAECAPISAAAKALKRNIQARAESDAFIAMIRSMAVQQAFVNFSEMDNYVCYSPQTWGNIQAWIGDVVVIAQRRCQ